MEAKNIPQEIRVESPREHYTADACIVWCIDNRFWNAFLKLLETLEINNFDPVFVPGGAKELADPDETVREKLLGYIQTSIRLHHTKSVILTFHSDCGAFGGLSAFGEDPKKESDEQLARLNGVRDWLRGKISPEIPIHIAWVDFEKIQIY